MGRGRAIAACRIPASWTPTVNHIKIEMVVVIFALLGLLSLGSWARD
jgi:hypothetical protein